MSKVFTRHDAHELVEHLPENATWHDLAYRAAVRADIESGLADSAAGRTKPVADVLKEFGFTV